MLLPFDDLTEITTKISETAYIDGDDVKYDAKKCIDIITEYLMMCYISGIDNAAEELACENAFVRAKMVRSVHEKTAGEDFTDRITKWANDGKIEGILRVAHTEGHRVYNQGGNDQAVAFEEGNAKPKQAGATQKRVYKQWITMEDEKVRLSHQYLDGISVPLNALFFTMEGDSAYYPGGFSLPENNVNCRCVIKYFTK